MLRSLLRSLSAFFLLCLCSSAVARNAEKDSSRSVEPPIPMEQLKAFADTYWKIKQSYVDRVDDKQLLEGAINGMLKSLDPYSGYLNEDDLMDLQASSEGVYDGLGVEVVSEEKHIKIVKTLDGSPAQRAGIKANDLIVAVDSIVVAEAGVDKAIDAMRGKAGEPIQLRVVPQGKGEEIQYHLIRETLEMKSVIVKELADGYWHVELSVFQRDSGYELEKAILNQTSGKAMNGLILDLRNNPGGVLRAAVDVADLLLETGVIVSTEGRAADSIQRYFANPGDSLELVPMVVLINERSASASEIVAGALQDHHRALVLGSKSYGKGVVQSILPIRHNAAIKLTTSRYYTPKGRSIHGLGIKPDVTVSANSEDGSEDLWLEQAVTLLAEQSERKL
ncbi:S41 family peptidase [Pleionea sediminis]|uniref:S41 family peptidase n=1 Tax=Pleionea sediminis TaxID=2569479 RepID=UPI00118694AC|nr:S41 family peptidase [Pleionea sediminis]